MDAAPIIQEWLTRLPVSDGPRVLSISLAACAVGLVLWVAGARISRSFFALLGVTSGALLGLHLPRWMGWEIDSMAVAIGASLALGFAGYLFHMICVGFTLGTLFAIAGVVVAWRQLADDATWTIPMIDPAAPIAGIIRELWHSLPAGLSRVLPIAAGGCFAFGGLFAALFPKSARILMFSLLGSILLVSGGAIAIVIAKPQWMDVVPTSPRTQMIAFAVLVVLGSLTQWMVLPRWRKPSLMPLNDASSPVRAAGMSRSLQTAPRDVRDLGPTPSGPRTPKGI